MHSYIFKKVKADEDIDVQASKNWLNTGLSPHIPGDSKKVLPFRQSIKQ